MSSASSKIYGLIGYPVKHSFSPVMHNAAFEYIGMDAEYRLFPVIPRALDDFFQKNLLIKDTYGNEVRANDILGFNVTVPHKERVLDFISLDRESAHLNRIRAVNTVVRKGGICSGYNTDIDGFRWHLMEKNFFKPQGKRIAILGAGGAARAVTYALAKSGAGSIAIFDIEQSKSESIAEMIKGIFPECQISCAQAIEELDIPGKDLLVNATPVGLNPADPCLVGAQMLHKGLFVYDLIYNPLETKLLALARKCGCLVSNGLGMLQYQGALSFQYFTGAQVPIEKIFRVMGQALRKEIDKL
ncbi:shikimate dehydrogenase [Candidatus Omnitrophota bacterium]